MGLDASRKASSPSGDSSSFFSPLPLGTLGLNAFNNPLMFQVSYVFPPPALVPLVLSKFLAECIKGQLRLFWWHHVGWRLLGFPQFLTLIIDVLVGHVLKGRMCT